MFLFTLQPLAKASAGTVDFGHEGEDSWRDHVQRRPQLSVARIYVPRPSRGEKADRQITEKEELTFYFATRIDISDFRGCHTVLPSLLVRQYKKGSRQSSGRQGLQKFFL